MVGLDVRKARARHARSRTGCALANKLIRRVVGGLSLGTVSISISLLILAILLGFGVYQKGAALESFNGWIYSALSLMHGSCDKAVMLLTKLGDPIPAAIIAFWHLLFFT